MAIWLLQYEYIEEAFKSVLQWSVSDGTGWSTVKNVTDDLGAIGGFAFQPDNEGNWMLMVLNVSSSPVDVEWWHWDEGWIFQGNLLEEPVGKTGFLKRNENGAIYATLHEVEGQQPYGPSAFVYWDGTEWIGPIDFE